MNLIDEHDRTLETAEERTNEGSKRSLVKMQIETKAIIITTITTGSEKNKTNK